MSTIAIIGAGPGVGAAVARRFGAEGFAVAMIARNQEKLDELVASINAEGITTRGYAADVLDPGSLRAALSRAGSELGHIDVLQYSPIPARQYLKPVLDTSPDDLSTAFRFSVVGLRTAVDTVLPGMRSTGKGTIVLINGGTAVRARAHFAGTSVAFAGESALGEMLHETLRDEGIHVTQLVVPGAIDPNDPQRSARAIAERIWRLHTERGEFRDFLSELNNQND
ncbi:SDR family NAD(P)-dependent oxidoreductase [Tessaracoccus palaemonis]|uniref:SDR family NAD(P)-dependent oxidoreductase n=1 Tax=Tessaracoccus palaemonis TaxID=2829499 RepID=A0ABX8SJB7_9ACTN|nr:SDR family NAD(P)-dependent oxidoreductase [Tessaracoccus palaemonis]QXT63472.1 SDR family NAD(P)-dependent oxidoreductase [Tessaracoccus palaemonis]